jgi:PEP-CTERM motif
VTGGAIFNSGSSFATSAGTLVIGSLSGDATFTATIPEPSTWAMMLLGFAGLGFAGYRRSRKAVSIAA